MKYETWNNFRDDCGKCSDCVNDKNCEDHNNFTLSTTTECPTCHNKNVHLTYCDKVVWKICDQCKTVFFCSDATTVFTDWDFKKCAKENANKSLEDYKKEKIAYLENKYCDYQYMQHPIIT